MRSWPPKSRAVRAQWTSEETETADEFLAHGRAIRAERELAAREGREPNLIDLLDSWGGVTIAYRRRLIDAPSYTLNHEEVALALEEGIRFAENLTPEEVEVDSYGHAAALHGEQRRGRIGPHAGEVDPGGGRNAAQYGAGPRRSAQRVSRRQMVPGCGRRRQSGEAGAAGEAAAARVLMSMRKDGRGISFFGDLHPSYAGNVVKAMASAKQGYPVVSRLLGREPRRRRPRPPNCS